MTYLWTDSEWNWKLLQKTYIEIERIGIEELGLDPYPASLEIISSEQMLDAYSSIGMPVYYKHWSFGKAFTYNKNLYDLGMQGLAYEIVINSNPCISYLMEENTMTMQALVMAHANQGHSHFFKNNHLFQTWTDASSIIDYLVFARDYIRRCEERENRHEVETFLDSCHALMNYGVNRFKRPGKLSAQKEKDRQNGRDDFAQSRINELFDRLLKTPTKDKDERFPREPEENILYFCEKYAPSLPEWKREILRIVRKISQYFYPQSQTKVGNESCATYTHYRIMHRLHELGMMTDGSMIEFLTSHTNVVFQPHFDDPRYSGINPYALGFAMMRDIERICKMPTAEDRKWFPDIAGCNDEMTVLKDAWANYRDESMIRQYLSPKVIRDFKLFHLKDNMKEDYMKVTAIHDDQGYDNIRETLADQYEQHNNIPQIEVVKLDLKTRTLYLVYRPYRNRVLKNSTIMLQHIKAIWGHDVVMHDEKGVQIV